MKRNPKPLAAWTCAGCGYDLRGVLNGDELMNCPECGARCGLTNRIVSERPNFQPHGERRRASSEERALTASLCRAAGLELAPNYLEDLEVIPYNIGGTRGFWLTTKDTELNKVTSCASGTFRDTDGMLVVATLLVDRELAPFEIEFWKCDFSPLERISPDIKILDDGPVGNSLHRKG